MKAGLASVLVSDNSLSEPVLAPKVNAGFASVEVDVPKENAGFASDLAAVKESVGAPAEAVIGAACPKPNAGLSSARPSDGVLEDPDPRDEGPAEEESTLPDPNLAMPSERSGAEAKADGMENPTEDGFFSALLSSSTSCALLFFFDSVSAELSVDPPLATDV